MFSVGSVHSEFRCKFGSGKLRVVASYSRERVSQKHEAVIERNSEVSAVK
jgi:hypothetical protein